MNPDFYATALDQTDKKAGVTSIDTHINEINSGILRRQNAKRRIIAETFKLGALLTNLKENHKELYGGHGNWEGFVTEYLHYSRPREAQKDMQFYRFWKPYAAKLYDAGIVPDVDDDLVSLQSPDSPLLSDPVCLPQDKQTPPLPRPTEPQTTNSALQKIMSIPDEYTDSAVTNVLSHIEDSGHLSLQQASDIATAYKMLGRFNSEAEFTLAQVLIDEGVYDQDILSLVPRLALNDEISSSVVQSKAIFVPGSERQLPLNKASITDFELALGREEIEHEIQSQVNHGRYISGINNNPYTFSSIIEGDPESVLKQLQRYFLSQSGGKFKVTIMKQYEEQPITIVDVD